MATKTSKTPRRKRRAAVAHSVLLVQSDGTMLLASASTGKVRVLTPEESEKVLPLLRQRQKLGRKLAALLLKKGRQTGDEDIWDLEL